MRDLGGWNEEWTGTGGSDMEIEKVLCGMLA